jgi:hypothetical protein
MEEKHASEHEYHQVAIGGAGDEHHHSE